MNVICFSQVNVQILSLNLNLPFKQLTNLRWFYIQEKFKNMYKFDCNSFLIEMSRTVTNVQAVMT